MIYWGLKYEDHNGGKSNDFLEFFELKVQKRLNLEIRDTKQTILPVRSDAILKSNLSNSKSKVEFKDYLDALHRELRVSFTNRHILE